MGNSDELYYIVSTGGSCDLNHHPYHYYGLLQRVYTFVICWMTWLDDDECDVMP